MARSKDIDKDISTLIWPRSASCRLKRFLQIYAYVRDTIPYIQRTSLKPVSNSNIFRCTHFQKRIFWICRTVFSLNKRPGACKTFFGNQESAYWKISIKNTLPSTKKTLFLCVLGHYTMSLAPSPYSHIHTQII